MSNGSASLAIIVMTLFYFFVFIVDAITNQETNREEINQKKLEFKVNKKANGNKYFKIPKVKRINVKPNSSTKRKPKRYYVIKF